MNHDEDAPPSGDETRSPTVEEIAAGLADQALGFLREHDELPPDSADPGLIAARAIAAVLNSGTA